jgi:group II intron reverse transcriptase/maturase
MKQSNKPSKDAAEIVEGRALTKRNVGEDARGQTQSWKNTMSRLARVREAAMRDKKQSFTALMHHVTPELLLKSFYKLKRQAAKGVDGVSWFDYQTNLEPQIHDLYRRIQSGQFRPLPARRIHIPKDDGKERPLSILSIEDKIAQQAVVTLLNQIYEVDFLGFSYGFRPIRSQHDALDALTSGINKQKVNWVLDLDIEKFFDTVEHDWLIQMIRYRVQDERLLSLIIKWIRVGYRGKDGRRNASRCGVPQGAVISPLLANIYLHYVFDLWVQQWRSRTAKGDVTVIRFADDGVLGFQYHGDATSFLELLKQRLLDFGLLLHPEKTRLIRFGRYAALQHKERGLGKPGSFDFLGFTHYCTMTRNGTFMVGRKTSRKRLVKQIRAIQTELRRRMHHPIPVTARWLRSAVRGHLNYYAVPGNGPQLSHFHSEVVLRWFKILRRRSQRHSITWAKFGPWVRNVLPKVRIVHPYPELRFDAKYSR